MAEQNGFHWCWDRLQFMSIAACESRVKKETCKILSKPKALDPYWREFFHKEKDEITLPCQENSQKKIIKELDKTEAL